MATVKVKFRPSTVKDRQGTIVYVVTHCRVIRQITTGYKVFPYEWDMECAQLIIPAVNEERTAVLRSIGGMLHLDMERLDGIISRFDCDHFNYTSDEVVAEFRRIGNEHTLYIFMESVIRRLYQLNHWGTAKNYRAALGSFKRFRDGKDILLDEITPLVMEDYQAYLKSTDITPNSISFYIRILRAVYNRAVNQELTKDRKPFRTVFTGAEKTFKRAISIIDIKRIRELELSLKPGLEFARDLFLFLFFCRGMSFIDAAFLKKTDIQNNILTYRRHKTGQMLRIKIVKPIKELINRYTVNESPYLLPIVINPGTDERKQYETVLRRTNNSLKVIADIIKLPIPLTTYVSRHAWATIAKSKNVPVNVISDALGHDSISTTQIYLASIDTSVIDKANDLIIRGL